MTALLLFSLLALPEEPGFTVIDKPSGEEAFRAQSQFRIEAGGAPVPHGQMLRFALTNSKPIRLTLKARKLKKSANGSFGDDGPASLVLVKLVDAAGKTVHSTAVKSGSGEWTIPVQTAAKSNWRPKGLPPLIYGWTPWKLTISVPPMSPAPVQVDYDLSCGGASLEVLQAAKTVSGAGGDLRAAYVMQYEGTYLIRAWAEGTAGREAGKIQSSRLVLGRQGGDPAYDKTKSERHDFMAAIEAPAAGVGKKGMLVLSSSARPVRLTASIRLQPTDRSLGATKF